MIASSSTLAAAFVSCLVMVIGMPLGRRNCIIIGNVLITIGGVIQAASYSVPQIIVARVLCVCGSFLPSMWALLLRNRTNSFDRGLALQYANLTIILNHHSEVANTCSLLRAMCRCIW